MPPSNSTPWLAECTACHHSNPARAHFCSFCGAALHAADEAAPAAAAAGAPPTRVADEATEPQGFVLQFNADNTLAIAPRYDAADTGTATQPPARPDATGEGLSVMSLRGPQDGAAVPEFTPSPRAGWPTAAGGLAVLALLGVVAGAGYLMGRGASPSAPEAVAAAPVLPAATPAPQAAAALPLAAAPLALVPTAVPAQAAPAPSGATPAEALPCPANVAALNLCDAVRPTAQPRN